MRTLYLVRHAKASRDDPTLPDRERPLDDRGLRDAPKVGKRLAERDARPDLILSSPARRALATAELIAERLDYRRKDIVVDDRLYGGAPEDLLAAIRDLDRKVRRVMLVGHNPELLELAHQLSESIVEMPTCAVAEFAFEAKSWSEIGTTAPARAALHVPGKR